MTFNEAMATECNVCYGKASHHRMTATRFYCTVLNRVGRDTYQPAGWRTRITGQVDTNTIVYRTKVTNLERSTLPREVREVIANGLTSYA